MGIKKQNKLSQARIKTSKLNQITKNKRKTNEQEGGILQIWTYEKRQVRDSLILFFVINLKATHYPWSLFKAQTKSSIYSLPNYFKYLSSSIYIMSAGNQINISYIQIFIQIEAILMKANGNQALRTQLSSSKLCVDKSADSKSNQGLLQPYNYEDSVQSSIAQQQVFNSQKHRKLSRRSSPLQMCPASNMKEGINQVNKLDRLIQNQNLIGNTFCRKTQIVTMNQVRKYEQDSKNKKRVTIPHKKPQQNLNLNIINRTKNQKPLKKSLSSSKLNNQRHTNSEELNSSARQSLENGKQDRVGIQDHSFKSQGEKQIRDPHYQNKHHASSRFSLLNAMPVPFFYENLNTGMNNLQSVDGCSIGSVRSQKHNSYFQHLREKSLNKNNGQSNSKENNIYKQISSTRHFIDVPLDLNEHQYQLDLQVSLQKNRGFQVYFITPECNNQPHQTAFKDVSFFKYEMIKLPPNFLRMRVYIHIQDQPRVDTKVSQTQTGRTWKVWKQVQIPIMFNDKTRQNKNDQSSRVNLSQQTKVSIINMALGWVRIRIDDLIDFNLKLSHQQAPTCFYCIQQDYNGVELKKLSLLGKQGIKATQQFISDGCQGKCQII